MSSNVSPAYHKPGSIDGYIIITDHPYDVTQDTTHPYDVTHRHNTTLQGAHALILTVLANIIYQICRFAGNKFGVA
jgi:hypothetical protein